MLTFLSAVGGSLDSVLWRYSYSGYVDGVNLVTVVRYFTSAYWERYVVIPP